MRLKRVLRSGWGFAVRASRKFAHDHIAAYSAQATFYLMLCVFPFTMLIVMATRLLPIQEETVLSVVRVLLPEQYEAIGVNAVDSYYNDNISSAKIVLILFLIWTASRLVQAMMNGFNSVYGIEESRSQTVLRLIGCLYTIALCGLLVALIVMYALGSKLVTLVLSRYPQLSLLELIANLIRNLASPLLLLLVFWLSYAILPSRKTHFREALPGALMTAVFWRLAAQAYTVFLQQSFRHYSYVYGTMTGLVMILVWLYACVYCWFMGAELNWYLKCRHDLGTLPGAIKKHLFRTEGKVNRITHDPAEADLKSDSLHRDG